MKRTKVRAPLGVSSVLPLLIAVLAGCKVGPKYERPAVDSPTAYRTAASDTNAPSGEQSFADLGWWDAYDDTQLNAYLAEALTNSWDLKITAARVLQAEASLRISRSQLMPTVNAGGDWATTRTSQKGPSPAPPGVNPMQEYGDAFVAMPAYEVDLWGKLRSANAAARARLLATEDAQRTVRQTLVAQVAAAYLTLLELDLELEIGRASYVSRTNSLELTTSREQGGVASMQDVYQSRILVAQAEASIVNTLKLIEQTENELNLLLGRNPGTIVRGRRLVDQQLRASVPAGLPSSLLERRPDIRVAEQELVAANADIGQVRPLFIRNSRSRASTASSRSRSPTCSRARRGRGNSVQRLRCLCSRAESCAANWRSRKRASRNRSPITNGPCRAHFGKCRTR